MNLAILLLAASAVITTMTANTQFAVIGDTSRSVAVETVAPGDLNALALYSEPSHALLGVFARSDDRGKLSPPVAEWLASSFPEKQRGPRFPMASVAFQPGTKMHMQVVVPPPSSDNFLGVVALMMAPGSTAAAERRYEIHTKVRNVAFTLGLTPTEDVEFCCGPENGNDCQRNCIMTSCTRTLYCCYP